MSDRVYEVEQRCLVEDMEAWQFIANLPVNDYAIREAFLGRAEREDWRDGEYRLLSWEPEYASGSYYLVTLSSETRRTAVMASPVREEAAA